MIVAAFYSKGLEATANNSNRHYSTDKVLSVCMIHDSISKELFDNKFVDFQENYEKIEIFNNKIFFQTFFRE